MGLSANKSIFGIHSICAYNPDTRVPYGIIKVNGSFSMTLTGEQVPLNGGSLLFPWAVAKGVISTEGNFLIREVPDWTFEAFQGSAATTNAAETGGSASIIENVGGASVVATTGVASVGVKAGSEDDVKSNIYVVKAASATTVNVYALTDVDSTRGTNLEYQDDALKITASPLTIATSTAVEIPNTGLELTGGTGTIAMTTGDTAWLNSRSINTGSATAVIGASGETIPDVGFLVAAQKKGNSEIFYIDIFRAAVSGFPFNFTEKAWMESDVSFQAFYDATRNGVYSYTHVDGV